MSTLILVEHDHQSIKPSTLSTITAATQLGQKIDLLILGHQLEKIVAQATLLHDVNKIIVGESLQFEKPLAEIVSAAILEIASAYSYILAPATTFGKNILPRVAAKLDIQQISDVIAIESPTRFTHPIYAGNALQTIETQQSKNIMTVRATAFSPVPIKDTAGPASITRHFFKIMYSRSKFISLEESKGDRPELTAAKIVVSGGRGVG
jgi:electron transfer flavoprotein alpha subunit